MYKKVKKDSRFQDKEDYSEPHLNELIKESGLSGAVDKLANSIRNYNWVNGNIRNNIKYLSYCQKS